MDVKGPVGLNKVLANDILNIEIEVMIYGQQHLNLWHQNRDAEINTNVTITFMPLKHSPNT